MPCSPALPLNRSCHTTVAADQASDGYKWTNRLLAPNPKMQEVINNLLELAYLPPHTSLHAGKVRNSWT